MVEWSGVKLRIKYKNRLSEKLWIKTEYYWVQWLYVKWEKEVSESIKYGGLFALNRTN